MSTLTADEIRAHNAMVAELWEQFGRKENMRVPITFAADEFLWLKLTGNSFREFYTDPGVQLKVLLAGDAWFRENIVHDRAMGPPGDAWTAGPRFWMDEPECFGCEVVIQDDDFAWSYPCQEAKGELLARLADIDPTEMVRGSRLWRLHEQMSELADGMRFHDLPVRIASPGGTHGIFTVACRVRGMEQLCIDMLDDPEFAHRFLAIVTEKTIGRILAWHELAETGQEAPSPSGWGMADDSLQLVSADTYRQCILPHHERIYSAMTTGRRHFRFVKGPLFANIVLADEINRTPPKTQAALLQAMQEYHVTSSGEDYSLDLPFFVLATQNPIEQEGTYPLPEAQLDRFMFMVYIDYPSLEEEREIIKSTTYEMKHTLSPVLRGRDILAIQNIVRRVPISDHVINYAISLVRATRPNEPEAPEFVKEWLTWGAGPRAGQYLVLGAKARAILGGGYNVSCADVRAMAHPVLRHRIFTNFNADAEGITPDKVVARLVKEVPEPSAAEYRAGAKK